ncbi:MAG: N-acetylmuramoyl-L-alanine amidase [Eggerthellaceae bacterium]|nr:N-acetylmuramoyl-L-alanine amidase [Eggerthellaceae bacterium]
MKLFVIPGHGAGDPGACGHGYEEAERVRALAKRIKHFGGSSVTLADFDRDYYADNGISRLNLPADTQIVELHMDSGPSSARGGHVIIQAGIGGADAYDKALAKAVAKIFPGRAQTLVERDDLANPARAAAKGYGYRLVENGFISNASDVKVFKDKMDELAKAYLAAFGIKATTATATATAAAAAKAAGTAYKVVASPSLNVRSKASTITGKVVGSIKRGKTVYLTNVRKNKAGNTWGKVASGTYKGRYVSVVFHGETLCKKA